MKSATLMFLYAGFLLICGITAFVLAPEGTNPKTALIISGACAAVMVICGVLAGMIHRQRLAGMIGIHAGLVLPLVFALLFAWRGYGAFGAGSEKRYLAVILTIMAVGSVIAFLAILKTRPRMERRA